MSSGDTSLRRYDRKSVSEAYVLEHRSCAIKSFRMQCKIFTHIGTVSGTPPKL